jgi:hypothetical protein
MRRHPPVIAGLALALALGCTGTVMNIMGLLVMLDWPGKLGLPERWAWRCGVLLIAMGQYFYAAVAAQIFPAADPRLSGLFELLPWLVVAFVVIGGFIW